MRPCNVYSSYGKNKVLSGIKQNRRGKNKEKGERELRETKKKWKVS